MIMHTDLINTLQDLVRVNNDRSAGYDNAVTEVDDPGLQHIFQSMADQSREYAFELNKFIKAGGGQEEPDTSMAGDLYRTWMDLKADFTNSDSSVLASCEYGEDVTLRVYNMALSNEVEIPGDMLDVITRQQGELRLSHDRIKKYRDLEKESK
ncbi:PA2169 family four-helix-bundle protein [uncultured Chitinophaga sp.]|jgi:conserved hypothetical protein|uniref:PA2169 family four-helix-bundle protein n=1 Tax=uncultured Chitinophaga sp. TaxID=339340 RepID=UPI002621A146|nr:PA2169 family four-helix-bundle protein [uncultured Chitinophaga sp.]